jgi:hypothetical protein
MSTDFTFMQNPKSAIAISRLRRNRKNGHAALALSLILSMVVFALGLLAFEISQYILAGQQLKANVQIAALTCETTLAQSANPGDITNQINATNTALSVFQLNSILGNSLKNAALVANGQIGMLTSGQAALSFQFLDPLNHAVVTNPTATSGTVIQAIATYGYSLAFSKMFGMVFLPIQMATTAVSRVQELDMVVALDISGGMDDETPVTFLQRYWDYDNNNPPHHIVYMQPALGGILASPAQGPLGSLFCNKAPMVNALAPQSLQNGTDPTMAICQQNLQGTISGITNSSGPPGNYVLPYIGGDTAPGISPTTGAILLHDLTQIAKSVVEIDSLQEANSSLVQS